LIQSSVISTVFAAATSTARRRDDWQDLLAGLPRSYTIVQSAEEWPISITRFTWRFTFVNGIRKR
jgi:hypothetical protein